MRAFATGVVVAIIATMLAAVGVRSTGLDGRYFANTNWRGTPRIRARDGRIDTALLDRRASEIGGPYSVDWTGFLVVTTPGDYEIATTSSDGSLVWIDGRLIVDNGGQHGPSQVVGRVILTRGPHPIKIRYSAPGNGRLLDVQWRPIDSTTTASATAAFEPIPPEQLWVSPPGAVMSRLRPWLPRIAQLLLAAWYVVFGWALMLIVPRIARAWWPDAEPLTPRGLRALLAIAAAIFIVGVWWGLPDFRGWAPDELTPVDVIEAQRQWFSGGWFSIYPPLHYIALAVWSLPFLGLDALGLISLDDLSTYSEMFIAGRVLSVLMALGLVGVTYAIARDIRGPRAGFWAVAVLLGVLPCAYYAKTANVDVPYVFWASLALACYVRVLRVNAARDFILFALTGTLAVCAKDQAYGFFVLPALYMAVMSLVGAIRRHRPQSGVPSVRVLCLMTVTAVAVFVTCQNLIFNLSGFREHLAFLAGPSSQNYRMVSRSIGGELQLLWTSLIQLGQALSWPLAILAAIAVARVLWRGPRELRWLLLPALSYYLTVIGVILYAYDRFFLGVLLILAIATGVSIADWTVANAPHAAIRRVVAAGIVIFAVSRAVSLDALMVRDARYCAEAWFDQHASAAPRIVAAGPPEYFPRQSVLHWMPIALDLTQLSEANADYVILNVLYATRETTGSRHEFYQRLEDGTAGYSRIASCRTTLPFSPLHFEGRFQGVYEDAFSNLGKVNPPIDIYVRRRDVK
jgi:PA14 domain/Dolichyl-phosphate-mannose-protein mannosyltransferase